MRTPLLILLGVLAFARAAAAQIAGPYASGVAGMSAGEGGAAPAGGAAVGWMSSRHVGFEIEIAFAPHLDLRSDDGMPRIAASTFARFPAPTFESRGRLLTFQTNALLSTGWRGRWSITLAGGGGAANLRRTTKLGYPSIVFPTGFFPVGEFPGVVLPPLEFTWTEQEITASSSALCLNVGGLVDYALTRGVSAGMDARYLHAFFGERGMHNARVAGRVSWRF